MHVPLDNASHQIYYYAHVFAENLAHYLLINIRVKRDRSLSLFLLSCPFLQVVRTLQ